MYNIHMDLWATKFAFDSRNKAGSLHIWEVKIAKVILKVGLSSRYSDPENVLSLVHLPFFLFFLKCYVFELVLEGRCAFRLG